MPIHGFDETLARFGLERLKVGLDLQLTKSGDIAITRDGDLQFGNRQGNALFRFVERWRHSESSIGELFLPMLKAGRRLIELTSARERGEAPQLHLDPNAYHETTEAIVEADLLSATLAGAIFVILNNLFYRLKLDLNATDDDWRVATPVIQGFSFGQITNAAAANFRHYDEWAATKSPKPTQLDSMNVLCGVLARPVQSQHGIPTIRENICWKVLEVITQGSLISFHEMSFVYAKSLAKFH